MSSNPLPQEIFSRAVQILQPLVNTDDDREALLTQAFYGHPLLSNIQREGRPNTFAVRCVQQLLDFGCLGDGEHALARLLMVVREQSGVQRYSEIDRLAQSANRLCQGMPPDGQDDSPDPGIGLRPDGLPHILWCEVPAGEFIMGSDDGHDDEKPRRSEYIPLPYHIAKYPVTYGQLQTV
ncbi:MAG: hypothetical protein GYB67_19640, partial [Chloroflexi bacterium]|nr:hypothetical protein [Chloroflexota bacterium]